MASPSRSAVLFYPSSQSYTLTTLKHAFHTVLPTWTLHTTKPTTITTSASLQPDLQFCDYDELDWDLAERKEVLTNAYMLRKALIRKSYLCTTVEYWVKKNPGSVLGREGGAVPKSWAFELRSADELEELFLDELWELGREMEEVGVKGEGEGKEGKWWILKPAMADKGQGIRLFDSRERLQEILEEFEDADEDGDEDEESYDEDEKEEGRYQEMSTRISLSTMRDWVIQEYISPPLLIDPLESPSHTASSGRKFHLRVYTLAVGALQVYISTEILALFASKSYTPPSWTSMKTETMDGISTSIDGISHQDGDQDLSAHLTNTCLQSPEDSKNSVFLLSDLVGKAILSPSPSPTSPRRILTQTQINKIISKAGEIVGETFRAGLAMPQHFSVAENAFEVFGIDLLLFMGGSGGCVGVGKEADGEDDAIGVYLLEINACPDFKQTGKRLQGVIEGLFVGVLELAVKPFFEREDGGEEGAQQVREKDEEWQVGERRGMWLKCAQEAVGRSRRVW